MVRTYRGGLGLLLGAAILAAVTGCSGGHGAGAATRSPSAAPAPVLAGHCGSTEATDQRGLLVASQVWPAAGTTGHSTQITALDTEACRAAAVPAAVVPAPKCTVAFPGYPASQRDGALSSLGVRRIRSTSLVDGLGAEVVETVLEFTPDSTSPDSTSGADRLGGYRSCSADVLSAPVGHLLVVLDFAASALPDAARAALLDLATRTATPLA